MLYSRFMFHALRSYMVVLKPIFRRLDPGYLVVVAICLMALWPFLSRPGLPQETDAELHIFRLAELSRLVRGGVVYPRWAPHFYYGYGYPIFNYYAPLTYYLGLLVELLPGLGPVEGVKAVFALGLWLGSLGIYGFVRDNWGRPAALVAAAVYVYSPYIQFVDPYARGDLAESFSFGVFPVALWALDRFRRQANWSSWLQASLAVAAVILTHNLMAMVFFALLLAWAGWQVASGKWQVASGEWQVANNKSYLPSATCYLPLATYHLLLPLILGVGLTAFFWLPVGLEQGAVNLGNLIGDGGHFDYRNHFLSIASLLGPSRRLDWGASEPDFAFNLGLAQWLLGGLGSLALITGRARQRGQVAFFALTLAALLFFMLPVSAGLWERIPLLPFLQFPWRLLGPTAVVLSILAGISVSTLLSHTIPKNPRSSASSAFHLLLHRWTPAVLIALTLLLALPLSQVPPWPADFGDTTLAGYARVEQEGRWLGTTSTADFIPATVDVIPRAEPAMMTDLLAGRPPDRINRATLPERATVETETITPLHWRYRVENDDWFLLRLFLFDFPGWQARVDGEVVETQLGKPEGFLVIPVPPGRHLVDVQFASTPARRLAWSLSAVSLCLVLLVAWRYRKRSKGREGGHWQLVIGNWRGQSEAPGTIKRVMAAVLAVTLFYWLALQSVGWLRYQSRGYTAIPAQTDVYADFGRQIALIGFDAPATLVTPGETLAVSLYWKAQQPLTVNYQVFLHLLDSDGVLVAQSDKLNPGDYPTGRWSVDKYVRDEHRLTLPLALPAGTYRLAAGLWVRAEGWRLPLLDAQGEQLGDYYPLRTLEVKAR